MQSKNMQNLAQKWVIPNGGSLFVCLFVKSLSFTKFSNDMLFKSGANEMITCW